MIAINWREGHQDFIILMILVLSVLLLNSGLGGVLYRDGSLLEQNLNDGLILLVGGWLGMRMARRLSLPLWWAAPQDADGKWAWLLLGTGAFIVAANTFIHLVTFRQNVAQYLQLQPWMESMDVWHAVLISARAAITEEVIFRLFVIGMILWLLGIFNDRRRFHVAIAAVVSSAFFAFIHTSLPVSFAFGILLSQIYLRYGLLHVMVIHFFANLVPFLIIALLIA